MAAYRDPHAGGIREMEWFLAVLVLAIYACTLVLIGLGLWWLAAEVLGAVLP